MKPAVGHLLAKRDMENIFERILKFLTSESPRTIRSGVLNAARSNELFFEPVPKRLDSCRLQAIFLGRRHFAFEDRRLHLHPAVEIALGIEISEQPSQVEIALFLLRVVTVGAPILDQMLDRRSQTPRSSTHHSDGNQNPTTGQHRGADLQSGVHSVVPRFQWFRSN